jgi:hypothetical protein
MNLAVCDADERRNVAVQIQKYTLLYPPQGGTGPNRVATVLSKQTLTQQRLAQVLGLDQLSSTPRR